MATKKTVKPAEELEQAVEAQPEVEAEEEKAPEIKDAWGETIEMIVPRKPKGDDQSYYVCVNDRRFQIPANGKMQMLPKPIALILQDSLEMESEADDYAEKLPKQDPMNAGTIV